MRSADRASWLAEDPAEISSSILRLESPVLFGSGSIDPRIYRLSSGGSGGGGSRVHPVAELGHGGVSTSPTVAPTKRWMQMGPTIEPSLDEVHRHTRGWRRVFHPSVDLQGSPVAVEGRMHAFLRLPSTLVPWVGLGGSRTTRSTRHRKEGRRPEPLQKKESSLLASTWGNCTSTPCGPRLDHSHLPPETRHSDPSPIPKGNTNRTQTRTLQRNERKDASVRNGANAIR